MNITKSYIIKTLSDDLSISLKDGSLIFESFIGLIKNKSMTNQVKLSGFGLFCLKKTPKRIGRNPKSLESYIIPEKSKINFKPSKKVKETINL